MITQENFISELTNILRKRKMPIKDRVKLFLDKSLTKPCDYEKILEQELKINEAIRLQKLKDKPPLEATEQKAFVKWFRETYPDHKILMVRNDGYRLNKEKNEQLEMGLEPGATDLYIPWLKLWVEMKRVKGSVISEKQNQFRDYVLSLGDSHIFGYGALDAIEQVTNEIIKKAFK